MYLQRGELLAYDGARLRVLGICYDLRHVMMGNRSIKRVGNGLDREKMRHLSIVASEENL
nr:hypothetical protein [Halobacillus massiliensis]